MARNMKLAEQEQELNCQQKKDKKDVNKTRANNKMLAEPEQKVRFKQNMNKNYDICRTITKSKMVTNA